MLKGLAAKLRRALRRVLPIYMLGVPVTGRDQQAFRTSIMERCKGDFAGAYAFVDKVLDRIADKASSLLTFNSIFVGLSFALHVEARSTLALFGVALASASCLLLLGVVALNWRRDNDIYRDVQADFDRTLRLCLVRGLYFTLSLYLSVAAIGTFLIIILLG